MNWNNGNDPKEPGYYLATWSYLGDRRTKRVSELWFDGRIWWSHRHYFTSGIDDSCLGMGMEMTDLVIAWMKKPKPYTRK